MKKRYEIAPGVYTHDFAEYQRLRKARSQPRMPDDADNVPQEKPDDAGKVKREDKGRG